MNPFLAMLNEVIPYRNKEDHIQTRQLAFQRLLSIGIDIESEANNLSSSASNNASATTLSSHVMSTLAVFTKLDMKMTCFRYQKETNRVTFSRLPKDILADPLLTIEVYEKLKKALESWKLLPSQCVFQLHLNLIDLIANCSKNSITLQDLYRHAFSSHLNFLFEILFIDNKFY